MYRTYFSSFGWKTKEEKQRNEIKHTKDVLVWYEQAAICYDKEHPYAIVWGAGKKRTPQQAIDITKKRNKQEYELNH